MGDVSRSTPNNVMLKVDGQKKYDAYRFGAKRLIVSPKTRNR